MYISAKRIVLLATSIAVIISGSVYATTASHSNTMEATLAKIGAPMPVKLLSSPLVIPHPTTSGTEVVKTISLNPVANVGVWNIVCDYKTAETNNGKLPVWAHLNGNYWSNYHPIIKVDGKDVGYPSNLNVPVKFFKQSGTITFTNVFAKGFSDPSPNLWFANDDGTGNITIVQCTATMIG